MNPHFFRPTGFGVLMREILCVLILCVVGGLASQRSVAQLVTLTDGNSLAQFNIASQANNLRWQVDGVNQLAQQACWYRVGNDPEQSVHALQIGAYSATDTNFDGSPDTLYVRYLLSNQFKIETRYSLSGGLAGRGFSGMGEQISITSLFDGPLQFHFFQYADFNLQGDPNGDSADFTNSNAAQQYKGSADLIQTAVGPVPSHREIAFSPIMRDELNDGMATTLSDTPIGTVVGPGDMTWAYQWDFLLTPNGTFQISVAENISVSTPGDYNHNGVVDAGDYVAWRKGLGTTFTQSDYGVWRAHFGQVAGGMRDSRRLQLRRFRRCGRLCRLAKDRRQRPTGIQRLACPLRPSAGSGAGATANTAVPEPAMRTAAPDGSAGDVLSPSRGCIINSSTRDNIQQPTD